MRPVYYSPFAIRYSLLYVCPLPWRSSLIEKPRRHHLAALDEARLVRPVIGDGVVNGAEVLPHQHVAFLPAVHVAVLRLELVREQIVEQLVAFRRRQLVDL